MKLDFFAAKKYVLMECRDVGIGVQFHAVGTIPGPHTDGKTLHVFEPNGMWDDDQWDDWEYEVYHEIGHESQENCNPHWKVMVQEKELGGGTLLHSMWNLMSDHVQEHNRCGTYAGRDRVLKKGRSRFVNSRLLDDETMKSHCNTREGSIFKVASIYDTWRRETWNEYLVGNGMTAAASLDGDEKDMWDKLYNSGIKIEEAENEYEAYQCALDILDAMGEDVEQAKQDAKDAYKAQQGGGSGESGEGEGEGKGTMSEAAKDEINGMTAHVHYKKGEGESQYTNPRQDMHISYEQSYSVTTSFTPKDPRIIDIKKQEFADQRPDISSIQYATDAIKNLQGGKLLAGQVKRLLISMKQTRWQHGHKRGHISSKNLWKARKPVYDVDVFKRKTSALELDTAVTILTDNSGSMSGHKFAHAAKAGVMLNEAMSKVGIPVELLSFTDDYNGPINTIVKSFSEIGVNEEELINRYAHCASWMRSNSDGESILWAFDRLKRRKEKRRVLIVLSDGSPASNNGDYGAEVEFTRKVVKNIEEKTPIEIYGIGIMDENVKMFYKDHKVLNSDSELENMLLGLVKQKVMKV